MRLFVAIPLPLNVKKELQKVMQPFDGIRWQNPEQLHITLKFLGDTAPEKVDQIQDELGAIRHRPFDFTISGLGCFPGRSRPRVLWAGVGDENHISDLRESVEEVCSSVGFERESRSYTPHITLGRVKDASRNEVNAIIDRHSNLRIPDISVNEFVLYESRLSPDGAVHIPCLRFQLSEKHSS